MVKTKSNSKRFNKIIIGLSFIITVFLLVTIIVTVNLIRLRKQKESEIYDIKAVLSETQEKYTIALEEVEHISENINSIKNIETSIVDIKKDFFDNALKYETMVSEGKGSKRIAYLTIDDGPYPLTPAFLDVLDQYDILATFFLLGKIGNQYDQIYKRIAESGHTVANHTYSHAIRDGLYVTVDSFINDVLKQERFLYEKTGVKTNILRFPGGSSSALPPYRYRILERLRKYNYGYVDWNVSAGDGAKGPTKESTYNNIINGARNKKIIVILMHDYSRPTLSSLPLVIEQLKKDDFIFLPLFYESSMIIK